MSTHPRGGLRGTWDLMIWNIHTPPFPSIFLLELIKKLLVIICICRFYALNNSDDTDRNSLTLLPALSARKGLNGGTLTKISCLSLTVSSAMSSSLESSSPLTLTTSSSSIFGTRLESTFGSLLLNSHLFQASSSHCRNHHWSEACHLLSPRYYTASHILDFVDGLSLNGVTKDHCHSQIAQDVCVLTC